MEDKKWYQKFSNWLTIVIIIILVPILLINASIIIQNKKDPDKVPSVFGYKPFIVLSGSMETKIHVGDLVIVEVIDPASLKKEDVIAFRDAQGTVTTHRIIDIVEKDGVTYFITKGDNNSSQDQNLVEYKDVEGIYRFRVPAVGSMMDSLSKPTTIIIVALGITVICFLGFSVSAKKSKVAEDKEFEEFKRMKELEKQKENEEFEEFKKMKAAKEKESIKEKDEPEDSTPKKRTTSTKKTGEKKTKEAPEVKPVNKKASSKKSEK